MRDTNFAGARKALGWSSTLTAKGLRSDPRFVDMAWTQEDSQPRLVKPRLLTY